MNDTLNQLGQLALDLQNSGRVIPQSDLLRAYSKFKATAMPGQRISWYYRNDPRLCVKCDPKLSVTHSHGGVLVAAPGTEITGRELDLENLVVVQDRYPTGMLAYPTCGWFTLERVLANPALVEIIDG